MTTAPFTIQDAEALATRLHEGQFRRDGVTPYITHPRAVAESLAGESDEVIMAAWLHDVLEDTEATESSLGAAGVPESVTDIVYLLTRAEDEPYHAYLSWIEMDPLATKVKIADIRHNLSCDPTPEQIEKYRRAL